MRETVHPRIIAKIDIDALSEGEVLHPLNPWNESQSKVFQGWETPLAPRGAFPLESGISVMTDNGGKVLQWGLEDMDRALVTGGDHWRNYTVKTSILPLSKYASSNEDRNDWREALAGIVFRMVTLRQFYLFGIEGWRRLVLYRRDHDEWFLLKSWDVEIPEEYTDLEVQLDSDCIRCSADTLGVRFTVMDTRYPAGRTGVRSMGRCRIAQLKVLQTQGQRMESVRLFQLFRKRKEQLGKDLPQPVLERILPVKDLGGIPKFMDLREEGCFEMLIPSQKGVQYRSINGDLLWEIPKRPFAMCVSDFFEDQGRLICIISKTQIYHETNVTPNNHPDNVKEEELYVISGRTGEILASAPVPVMDRAVVRTDLCPTGGSLTRPGRTDFLLREWRSDIGHGGYLLMAMDKDLHPLWHRTVDTPYGYTDALQFYDVNGDGKDELLAGGNLYSCTGELLWEHDLLHEMSTITGAQHYNSVLIGHLSGDPELDPVAFLLAGSAGVYVVDGLTGKTRMVHSIGHAHTRQFGKWRTDLPGTEVLVTCHWGNMGIQTLFSGRGDHLWSIQPDYMGQGSCPVQWGDKKHQLLWVNTSAQGMGLYDGYGRKVLDLPELKALWGASFHRDVSCFTIRMGTDPRDHLCLLKEGLLHIFGQG